jgi:small-conductance mechanosensitive channel
MHNPTPPADLARFQLSETRISQLTLLIGFLAAVPVAFLHSARFGVGIFIGSILAWLNFRWLKQGLDALTAAIAERKKGKVPIKTYFKAMFRYGLIALIAYVIFKYLKVPALSMILGLCALGAATVAVSVYEILSPRD